MSFRKVRDDTLVGTIEARYGIELNARSDTKIGNLLWDRGFRSVSQLVRAHRGQATSHATSRSIFLSFHQEDLSQVQGFRLMTHNRHVQIDISEELNMYPVSSERSSYIKKALRQRIRGSEVVVCLIGNGTAWRDWVEWEIETAIQESRGLCGVRLKGSRGRTPPALLQANAPVAGWDLREIVAVIECAAARRS